MTGSGSAWVSGEFAPYPFVLEEIFLGEVFAMIVDWEEAELCHVQRDPVWVVWLDWAISPVHLLPIRGLELFPRVLKPPDLTFIDF